MNLASLVNPPPVYVEIGPDRLRVRHGRGNLELPLERLPDGRLGAEASAKAMAALRSFLKVKSWLPRPRAWCAISARGVSLRRLSLPRGMEKEFQQRLRLQVEAEFPLPPDELAWGWQPLGEPGRANGSAGRQEVLVAAVKKELVADYRELLRGCGTEPVFTLAAMARWNYCGQPAGAFTMLDIGGRQLELTNYENSVPTASRILFWDGQNGSDPAGPGADALAQKIKGGLAGSKLLITGHGISKNSAGRLAQALGKGYACEQPEGPGGDGLAAIGGLEKFAAQGAAPPLLIRWEPAGGATAGWTDWDVKKWGARAGALAAAALILPYAESLLLRPHLERKVAAFKTEAKRLAVIDREQDFLQELKLSQPPYLNLLEVFSKSVPPGTRFESLSLNSHGEVSLRAAFHDGEQVAEFRGKLIASGFFTNVVVEEQAPTPDRQKVNVRMSALEKTAAEMQLASARLLAEDAKTPEKSAAPGGAPVLPSGPPKGKAKP